MQKLALIIAAINATAKGTFVGITDYISDKGDVSSVTGQIGCSYGNAKEKALEAMEMALKDGSFDAMTVKGVCYTCPVTGELNSRKRSWDLKPFVKTFSKAEVIDIAKAMMDDYRNAVKKTNKVELSEKENGCYVEKVTDNINISLMVRNQTYKALESAKAKAEKGIVDKPKATMPLSAIKTELRKRFEPKIRAFTLKADNFKSLTIGGETF